MNHKWLLLITLALTTLTSCNRSHDVVVVGGTPGGIMTAVSASRMGHSVLLLERTDNLGGLPANGLGATDIATRGGDDRAFPRIRQQGQRVLCTNLWGRLPAGQRLFFRISFRAKCRREGFQRDARGMSWYQGTYYAPIRQRPLESKDGCRTHRRDHGLGQELRQTREVQRKSLC